MTSAHRHPRCSARAAFRFGLSACIVALSAGCASVPDPSQPVAAAPAEVAVVEVRVAEPPATAVAVDAEAPAAVASAPVAPLVAVPKVAPVAPPQHTGGRVDVEPLDEESRDLWARVRSGFVLPEIDNELVRKWEQWYASRPDYVQRMTERGSRFLFHVMEEIDRREMPSDLALLPFIESAFNPQATSVAAASGMWQFIPSTGRDFDLKQNLFRDDRRDVLASTRAALDYLQSLYRMFGDWQLALAAYNWGQGNVQRAIDRNRRAGVSIDYASLRLPDETRNYLPKLQAVKNIVLRPEAFALNLPELQNHPYFLTVRIDRDIDVAVAARLADLSIEDFQRLNPQLNKPVIFAAGTPRVLLPYDKANVFIKALSSHRGSLASLTAWVAPSTMKAAEAARRIGVPEERLRQLNSIPPRMMVRAGSTLLVPRAAAHDAEVAEHVADHAVLAFAPEPAAPRRARVQGGRKSASAGAAATRVVAKAAAKTASRATRPTRLAAAAHRTPVKRPAKGGARVRVAMN